MADKRKLNAEIDRCLKKVSEGGELFDDIWEKVQQSNNANQKEKLEMDLKKEIKKLQRLRDQIKTWSVSGEVKDKEPLYEARRNIEAQMEKFKVIEREAKTKAYSKEGLTTTGKVDPHERQKEEILAWVSNAISSFNQQHEKAESDAESLRGKKKMDKEDHSNLDACESMMRRQKFHLGRLEAILRRVDNDAIQLNQIASLRETVEYLVETPDDMEDVDIYDDLALDDITTPSPLDTDSDQSYVCALTNHVHSNSSTTNHTSFLNSFHQSASANSHYKARGDEEKKKQRLHDDSMLAGKHASTPKTPVPCSLITPRSTTPPSFSTNRLLCTPTTLACTLSNGSSTPQPIKSLATPCSMGLGYAQVVSSQYSANNHSSKGRLLSCSSNGLVNLPPHVLSNSLAVSGSSSTEGSLDNNTGNNTATQYFSSGAARVLFPTTTTTTLDTISTTTTTSNNSAFTTTSTPLSFLSHSYNINQQQLPTFMPNQQRHLFQQQQQMSQQQQLLSSQIIQQQNNQHFIQTSNHQPPIPNHQPPLPIHQPQQQQQWPPTSADNTDASKHHHPARLPNGFNNNIAKDAYFIQTSPDMLSNHTSTYTAPSAATALDDDLDASHQKTKKVDSPNLLQQQQQQQQYSMSSNPSYPPRCMRLESILGLTPLGPLPLSTDHLSKSSMLESASQHLPLPCDSEKIRVYLPSNPCTMPPHYPRGLNPALNLADIFNRLDPETLFFAFYYLEGTKAQFLAAKALKQKSWRFHTKYMVWFQRHEKPKTINEEYEQGTYIFFDYEQWSQRKKESFKFEYKYLEDHDLN